MTQEELDQLLQPEVQAWIEANQHGDPLALAKQRQPEGFPRALAVGQVAILQKASSKLPSWAARTCLIPGRAYEQCTSEALASAKHWGEGLRALDLSCGVGSDLKAMSRYYAEVHGVEPDPVLAQVIAHNAPRLGLAGLQLHQVTAEDFVASYDGPPFDLLYIDPDRRDGDGRRQYGLRDCQPDVIALLPRLQQIAGRILIKASPMLDLTALSRELPVTARLCVTAEGNECKEVLIELGHCLQAAPRAALFLRKGARYYFEGEPLMNHPAWKEGEEVQYVLEPDVALYKAGIVPAWLVATGLQASMACQDGFVFSHEEVKGFHGHQYEVLWQGSYKPELIRKELKRLGINRIQLSRRGFDLPIGQVRTSLKVQDGGSHFLLLTRTAAGARLAFLATRLEGGG